MDMNESLPVRLDDLINHITRHHPDGDPLAHLSDAVLLADRLDEQADHLIGHFVDQARRSGASWTQIGQHMGVSKQAAQKRFVSNRPTGLDAAALARFTDRARNVIAQAQRKAHDSGSDTLTTSHLLLGLISEPDSLAVHVIEKCGVTAQQVSDAAQSPSATAPRVDESAIPPDADTLQVVTKLTLRESLGMGRSYVGTEHILLAILADGDTAGARVLTGLGIDYGKAKAKIEDTLALWLEKQ